MDSLALRVLAATLDLDQAEPGDPPTVSAIGPLTQPRKSMARSGKASSRRLLALTELLRHPASHRLVVLDARRSLDLLSLVDLQLELMQEAVTARHDPSAFLGADELREGVRVERVVTLDLDADGVEERVICFSQQSRYDWRELDYLVLKRVGGEETPVLPLVSEGIPDRRILQSEVRRLVSGSQRTALAIWVDRGADGAEFQPLADGGAGLAWRPLTAS